MKTTSIGPGPESAVASRVSSAGAQGEHARMAPSDGGPTRGAGVPLHRTIYVELRKMVDTRAGRWLLGVMTAISLVVMAALRIWGGDSDRSYLSFLEVASAPLIMVLPIIGIMGATSEWSQRTGLVTFTLEPRRFRVVLAKVVAATLLGLIVTLSAFVAAAVANLLFGSDWDVSAAVGLGYVLTFAIFVLQGVAFGFAFLNTAFAIVAALVLPTAWMFAASLIASVDRAADWLDLNRTVTPLLQGAMTGDGWAQLATSIGFWVLLPTAVGTWRVLTREVK